MSFISIDDFNQFAAQGYNCIPVTREVLADLDTPLSAYLKLAGGPNSYLLESVQGGEKWGRYSIIGLSANSIFRVKKNTVTTEVNGQITKQKETRDPFVEIEEFLQQYNVPVIDGLPRFTGGLVGYFAYDCIRYIEPRLQTTEKDDPLTCPDIMLLVSDRIIVFDNVRGVLTIIVYVDPAEDDAYHNGQKELDRLIKQLSQTSINDSNKENISTIDENDFISGFTRDQYQRSVDKIKNYIVEGDAMQVVLSQRLSIPFSAPPLNLYRALRCTNPSPYMYYLNFDDFQVVGASPEILVRLEDNTVTVRPIAGTRPRGKTEAEDKLLEQELLSDPKELAEHLMLIDLGRNDIGRVTETGSIQLTEKMIVERYSHVMHIVSNVIGTLKQEYNAIDVLRATFPAGTVSGAPKIRAMEIIDELEPVKRGVYSGAVGYLSWAGNMDMAIAIRTAVIKNKQLNIQVGAGIVADSVPQKEWEETMDKGRATFRAVAMAEKGLI